MTLQTRRHIHFDIPEENCEAGNRSQGETGQADCAKALKEVDLNSITGLEASAKQLVRLPDAFILAPVCSPENPDAKEWLLSREPDSSKSQVATAPYAAEAPEQSTIVICSFDNGDGQKAQTPLSAATTLLATDSDMAFSGAMSPGGMTSPGDLLSQKLEEWTRDIECLLPFALGNENGHSHGAGAHAENGVSEPEALLAGESPIARIRDCCSALGETNKLLKNLAKVAELNSAKSELDQIETTIETLFSLMIVLGKITQAEVMRMKQLTEKEKVRSPMRLVPVSELVTEATAPRAEEASKVTAAQQDAPALKKMMNNPVGTAVPSRTRSVRQSMAPTFELTGEAISRRKREQIEAKRKADEEEARKKREFKARPAPSSVTPSSYPRDTAASRARQARAATNENVPHGEPQPQQPAPAPTATTTTTTTTSNKRYSMIMQPAPGSRPPLAVTSSFTSQTSSSSQPSRSRGRDTMATGSPSSPATGTQTLSRATSSSAGSAHGSTKRHSLSVEEAAQQKLRGREIFHRDNSFVADRERERREREAATRHARLEAAERSRQLSREWAEKQRAASASGAKENSQ